MDYPPAPRPHPSPVTLQLVVVETSPYLDEWTGLPEPFAATLTRLIGQDPDAAERCWSCGAATGYVMVCSDGPHGEELDYVRWRWAGLLRQPGTAEPVAVLCEECTPDLQPTPFPAAQVPAGT